MFKEFDIENPNEIVFNFDTPSKDQASIMCSSLTDSGSSLRKQERAEFSIPWLESVYDNNFVHNSKWTKHAKSESEPPTNQLSEYFGDQKQVDLSVDYTEKGRIDSYIQVSEISYPSQKVITASINKNGLSDMPNYAPLTSGKPASEVSIDQTSSKSGTSLRSNKGWVWSSLSKRDDVVNKKAVRLLRRSIRTKFMSLYPMKRKRTKQSEILQFTMYLEDFTSQVLDTLDIGGIQSNRGLVHELLGRLINNKLYSLLSSDHMWAQSDEIISFITIYEDWCVNYTHYKHKNITKNYLMEWLTEVQNVASELT